MIDPALLPAPPPPPSALFGLLSLLAVGSGIMVVVLPDSEDPFGAPPYPDIGLALLLVGMFLGIGIWHPPESAFHAWAAVVGLFLSLGPVPAAALLAGEAASRRGWGFPTAAAIPAWLLSLAGFAVAASWIVGNADSLLEPRVPHDPSQLLKAWAFLWLVLSSGTLGAVHALFLNDEWGRPHPDGYVSRETLRRALRSAPLPLLGLSGVAALLHLLAGPPGTISAVAAFAGSAAVVALLEHRKDLAFQETENRHRHREERRRASLAPEAQFNERRESP